MASLSLKVGLPSFARISYSHSKHTKLDLSRSHQTHQTSRSPSSKRSSSSKPVDQLPFPTDASPSMSKTTTVTTEKAPVDVKSSNGAAKSPPTTEVASNAKVAGIPSGESTKDFMSSTGTTLSRRARRASQAGNKTSHRPNLDLNAESYPRPIFTLIQNILPRMGAKLNYTGESDLLMLWNAILSAHFPIAMGYGITFHKSDSSTDPTTFLIVKLVQLQTESNVLVMGFNNPGGDTTLGREAVEKATMDYVLGPGFDETDFSEIYVVSSVGLSWTGVKLEEGSPGDYASGAKKPSRVVDWTTNMTSAYSFGQMRSIVANINNFTQKKAEKIFNELDD